MPQTHLPVGSDDWGPTLRAGRAFAVGAVAVCAQAAGLGLPASLALLLAGTGWLVLAAGRERDRRAEAARQMAAVLDRVARGEAGARLEASRVGDLGPAAEAVNRMIEGIEQARERIGTLARRLAELPEHILQALNAVQRSVEDQEGAVEETAALQANLNASIRAIREEVETLAQANDESAASTLEMGTAVDQVARSAAALQERVEASTSSLHEVGESIRSVAESGNSVQEVAEENAAAILQMDRAIQEVGVHVRGAAELTDRVSRTAEEGSQAVGATIQDIARIRQVTQGSKDALEGLAARIGEINEITTVIGSITDETNLLSLNAAIIAAQAGEHGKAFAVVADQVKELARRTHQSTHEIEQIILAIQEQSQRAVDAMAAGIDAVEQGVKRSRVAGESLDAIRISATEASGRVGEIARAAEEQANNSKQVAEAARRTSEHVHQISRAMSEQSEATQLLLENATASVDMCRQVAQATEEQRASGRFITASTEAITERIRSIQSAARRHQETSGSVAETVEGLLDNAHKSTAGLPELSRVVEELRALATVLNQELAELVESPAATDQPSASA